MTPDQALAEAQALVAEAYALPNSRTDLEPAVPAGLSREDKIDEIHAAIKNIERILIEDLAPMVGPALAGLEPILGKLNGPMGAILGSMLR